LISCISSYTGTSFADRRRAAARRVREIAVRLRTRGKLSREETTAVIRRVTGELAGLAGKAAAEAAAVLRNGRRALPKAISGRVRGRLRRALDELAVTMERTAKVIAQTRARLAGNMPDSATRLVSLHDLGVRTVAIPRQAATSAARKAVEHRRGFRQLVKWRTGCEGRISYLKRGYGWDRTLLDGANGAAIWCGHGVFAHNLVKISALAS
jgi:hypothetical protein